jgi:thioredoxin reductase (NADPH)
MQSLNAEWLMPGETSAAIASRLPQMFPALADAEISRIRRFGALRHYSDGARLYAAGDRTPGMFVVLEGTVTISQRDGLGHVAPIVRQGRGQFLAEIAQLSGGTELVDARADRDVEALLIPPDQLRTLLVAEAELGERITRIDPAPRGSHRIRGQWSGTDRSAANCGPAATAELSSTQQPTAPCRGSVTGRGRRYAVRAIRRRGGQAGASARIENYLGFPTSISGQALAGRAFVQAQKFGAEVLMPAQATSLDCRNSAQDGEFRITLTDGRRLRSRTIVVASGARYRRPAVPRLAEFEGRGVWYWASALEAKLCAGEEVAIVGGGNSAGQAAVFVGANAAKVHVLVRGEGFVASMSRYLIDRIAATPAIELHFNTELAQLYGDADARLTAISCRDIRTGLEHGHPVRNLFLFVGADPETGWLKSCGLALDAHGFVLTGEAAARSADGRTRASLESSISGVFAVGDVRSGSVKRVGGAIGEGAAAVALIHQHVSGWH